MNDGERALARLLYDLQLEVFERQGEKIAALRKANESLQKSHEVIGKMLKATAELMGVQ